MNQLHCCPQAQEIGVEPESGDLTSRKRCNHGIMPKLLPCVDIGHMDFDNGHLENRQGIPQSVTIMGPGTGIDDHCICLVQMGLVDLFTDLSLMIGLEALQFNTQFFCKVPQSLIDLIKSNRPILDRVPFPEHIVIHSV